MSIESPEVKCKIILHKFFDSTLFGEVDIITTAALEVKYAYVEICGRANCRWNLPNLLCRFPTVYLKGTRLSGNSTFFLVRRNICGDEPSTLRTGKSKHFFNCVWLPGLRGTWFGDHGSIKYTGTVAIKLLNNKEIYTHQETLHIKCVRNLYNEPQLGLECRKDIKKKIYLKYSKQNVDVSVWIPMSGVAAGQSLPVLCSVDNNSKINYGGLVFVLTRIDIYKSDVPISIIRKARTDVCRVARMVNIHKGTYNYYAVIHIDNDAVPTNQFHNCYSCQMIYELWIAVQASAPYYSKQPNCDIHTPGIPIIVGTNPIIEYNIDEVTAKVFKYLFTYNPSLIIEEIPEDVKKIIDETEEELTEEAMIENLKRQLKENEKALTKIKNLESFSRIKLYS